MNSDNLGERIKNNLKSGITVSLISLPLSVSLAVASQTTPIAGIVTAIWAGLMASLFGGSHFNIVGPTGALSGILASYAIANGADALPTLAIVSGIIIFVAYLLKLERFLAFIPGSTVQGFTLGVAIIIGFGQLNSALGIKVPVVHEKFIENLIESFAHIQTASWMTAGLFALSLLFLLWFAKQFPKIPGAIILAPIGILIGYLSVSQIMPISIATLGAKYPEMAPALFIPFSLKLSQSTVIAALTVSIVAILETMISAKIADGMTKTKHHKRKEMLGLSLANIASGLFGGIPATAALARTSLNIKSGATDKMSATISSVAIVIISFILLSSFKYIPMPVIAAILAFVAVRMVEVEHIKHAYDHNKTDFALILFVAFMTVFEDPIIGILLGATVSLLLVVYRLSHGSFDLYVNYATKKPFKHFSKDELIELEKETHTLVYSIKGQLSYINAQSHIARFETKLNGTKNIILRLREVTYLDSDGVEALSELIQIAHRDNRMLYITGVAENLREILARNPEFAQLEKEGRVFNKTEEALNAAGCTIKK